MENNLQNEETQAELNVVKPRLTLKDWRTKILYEMRDLLAGAAFPFMLMLILCSTVFSFIGYGGLELGLQILILIIGEVLLICAIFIFGKQNGTTAYKKRVQNNNKRKVNSNDVRSRLYIGEYSIVKSILIALISCLPYIVFLVVEACYSNEVCEFALMYAFGWAYYPFKLANLPVALNLIFIIPYVALHTGAYIYGGKKEKAKQDIIAIAEETRGKTKKK